jgi:TIR domain-containing protein
MRVFISYRRRDNHVAGRIANALTQHLGKSAVFRDVGAIPDGATFRDRILTSLSGADLVVSVISERWMGESHEGKQSRLHDNGDFVRLELEFALKNRIPVLPILIDDIRMPDSELFPDSLQQLSFFQAPRVRDSDFEQDIERLITTIKSYHGRKLLDIPIPAVGEPVTAEHLVLRHSCWRMAELDSRYPPNRVYGFAVALEGDPSVMKRVDSTLYLLPPFWGTESGKRVGPESSNFLFKNLTWSDLVVRARVYVREQGDPVYLSAFVRLSESGPRLG